MDPDAHFEVLLAELRSDACAASIAAVTEGRSAKHTVAGCLDDFTAARPTAFRFTSS